MLPSRKLSPLLLLLLLLLFETITCTIASIDSGNRNHNTNYCDGHHDRRNTLHKTGAGGGTTSRIIPTAFSSIAPSSFVTKTYNSRPIRSAIIPSSTNQLGHDRLSFKRTDSTAFRTTVTGNSCRNIRCTRIYAKQEIEEDVYLDQELSNNDLVQISRSDVEEDIIETTTTTASTSTTNVEIPPEFIPILTLCFLVTFLSALDRVAMSIAILPLSAEFGYTETIKGQISSAVSYGYAAAILPIGLAVSVVSARTLMFAGVGLWSLATLGTPWMAGLSGDAGGAGPGVGVALLPLLSIRAVMGAAEAVVLPTMQRILANWVPPEKKATALSIVISGFQLGTVGAYLVSPWVLDVMSGADGGPVGMGSASGWRGMFYVYGALGLGWMVPWWFVAKDAPSKSSTSKNDDGDLIDNCEETFVNTMIEDDASLVLNECDIEFDSPDDDDDAPLLPETKLEEMQTLLRSAPWKDFASSPGVWAMMLAHAAKNWELYNLLAWTPTFFSEQYGLNVKESAAFGVLPSVCGMVGGLTAGNAADYMLSRYATMSDDGEGNADDDEASATLTMVEKRTRIRKLFQSIALLGPATCLYLLSTNPEQASTAQILLGGAVGLQAFDAAGFGAATQEKAGERWAGLLYALTSLPGVMVGSVSVSVTGRLLDQMADAEGNYGSGWALVFQSNAAICVVGALAFLFLYDSKKEFD